MAIFHLHAQQIGRGKGQSAVAAAAYRHCAKMAVELDGRIADYSKKKGNIHSEFSVPDDAPKWAKDLAELASSHEAAEGFWNKVEVFEKHPSAQYANEVEFALPIELTAEENIALVRAFVADQFTSRGLIADWSYHDMPGNPHIHLMSSLRPLTEAGFGSKRVPLLDEHGDVVRRIPDRPGRQGAIVYRHFAGWNERLGEIRAAWAEHQNEHLHQAGHDIQVDHRSYAEQGLEIEPTSHRGPTTDEMVARGIPSERLEIYEEERARAFESIADNPSLILDMITREKAVFDERDIARIIHRYAATGEDFDGLFLRVGALEDLITLAQEIRDPVTNKLIEREKLTTHAMLDMEIAMIGHVREQLNDVSFGSTPIERQKAIDLFEKEHGFILSYEQVMVIDHATSDRAISAIAGYAGAGKSTVMSVVRDVYQKQGRHVFGGALAGKAAEELERASGIQSRTLASWRVAWELDRKRLQKGDVFILDEAGMVSSRDMAMLIKHVHENDAKLVLIGDARQLQPIGAGAALRAVTGEIGYVELTQVRRQYEEWMQTASIAFGRGHAKEGLQAYADHGLIEHYDDRIMARSALIQNWHEDWKAGANTLILAHTNKDVLALNKAARFVLQSDGALRNEVLFQTARGKRFFAFGDRVLFLENNRTLNVKNGMIGSVEKAQPGFLTIRLDTGRQVSVDQSRYGMIDYGYAATIHKSQGSTVDRVHVLALPMMDAQLSYVSMTRHRDEVRLYAGADDFTDADRLIKVLSRERLKETTMAYEHSPDYKVAVAEFAARRGLVNLADLHLIWREMITVMRTQLGRLSHRLQKVAAHLSLSHDKILPHGSSDKATQPIGIDKRDVASPLPDPALPDLTPSLRQALARLREVYRYKEHTDINRRGWYRAARSELTQMSSSSDLSDFNKAIEQHLAGHVIRSVGGEADPLIVEDLVRSLSPKAQDFFQENWSLIHAGQMAGHDKAQLDFAHDLNVAYKQQKPIDEYEAERAPYYTPDTPLIEGITDWSVSVEAAAHERLFKSKNVVNMRQSAKKQMAKAWRDPEVLLQKLEQAGGWPSKEVKALLKTMRNEPEKAGDLLGSTSFLGFKDEARRDALKAVLPAESMAYYYLERLENGLEQQIKGEKKWRHIMAEPLNNLSQVGRAFVETMNKAKDLPKGSTERLQIEKTFLSDKEAFDEVQDLTKDIRQRFGKGQEGFDRERLARTLNHLPKDANMQIRETMDNILSAEAQGREIKNDIHIARLKERSYGYDQSFGIG